MPLLLKNKVFKMKMITVVGARPQFIKAAALSRTLKQYPKIKELIIHTGQHFDVNMSEVFFEEMEIPNPNYQLAVSGGKHGEMTGQMLQQIESILITEKPDLVLVYGDTNSTLSGSLAASKLHIPIAHVEAGLRSFNMQMPEEINRILTDRLSKYLYSPTEHAVKNLEKEGFLHFGADIIRTGDIMYDAAQYYSQKKYSRVSQVEKLKLNKYILCTIHRAENTDNPEQLENIFKALEEISTQTQIVFPIHPRTKKILQKSGLKTRNIEIIDPVGYLDMLNLISHCDLIMTDSGGLQKEAYFFNKKCLTLRDQTEWLELVEVGQNTLVGTETDKIISAFKKTKNQDTNWKKNIYGDGHTSNQILDHLTKAFNL